MTIIGDMLMGGINTGYRYQKDGKWYVVFWGWNALYQYMMRNPNIHAHCAIVTINGDIAIEVYEVADDLETR